MQNILYVFLSLIWMIGMPIIIGGGLLKGYLILFSLMEIMALPMIFLKMPLHLLVFIYAFVLLLLAAVRLTRQREDSILRKLAGLSVEQDLILMVCILLIGIQMVVLGMYGHLDADDAFFVGAAVTDAATDTIFQFDPYTGFAYEALPMRYTLSPFPVFIAVMSRLCGQISPAVLAHRIIPPVFYLMMMECFWHMGGLFFKESDLVPSRKEEELQERNPKRSRQKNAARIKRQKEGRSWFLFFSILLLQFSAWSIYNAGDFIMVRSWQGKAVLAGILLPFLFMTGFRLIMEKEGRALWGDLWLAAFSSCLVSSMGIVLCPCALGILALLAVIDRGRGGIRQAGGFLAASSPCLILGVLALILW